MTDRKSDEPRGDEVDRRDEVADQGALEHARGRRGAREHRVDLRSGTRAWRTDHTEVMLVEPEDSEANEAYLRVTDVTTGNYVQALLAPDDLEIVARMLLLRATRLREIRDRR